MNKVLMAIVFIVFAAFLTQEADAGSLKDLDGPAFEDLIQQASKLSGIPIPGERRPIIVFINQEKISTELCGKPDAPECAAAAAYYDPDNTNLFINKDTPDDTLGRSIVVHEAVHWLQHSTEGFKPIETITCSAMLQRESAAYLAQNLYLRNNRDPRRLRTTAFCNQPGITSN